MSTDLTNSHYLNQENRIIEKDQQDEWGQLDADYNIRTGQTFGETEEKKKKKQGWRGQ